MVRTTLILPVYTSLLTDQLTCNRYARARFSLPSFTTVRSIRLLSRTPPDSRNYTKYRACNFTRLVTTEQVAAPDLELDSSA